jgi:putative ABC transport system permease protein
VRLFNGLWFHWVRLRARWPQECLAALGIAAGVALLFASQISSASLQSSVAQLSHGIAGRATLQLLARDPHGLPEGKLSAVRAIPGVIAAAAVLEAQTNAIGPSGAQSAELIGAEEGLHGLGGTLVSDTSLTPFGGIGAVVLSKSLGREIGVSRFGQEVHLQLAGRTVEAPLYTEPHERQSAPLRTGAIVLAPLSSAQELAGMQGRVSRILVRPAQGSQERVRAVLEGLAGTHLSVEGVDYDERLFLTAATASDRSTALFAAISALAGFLFAFNAVLFTIPARRRLVLGLHREGYTRRTVLAVLLGDALGLGLIACALGIVLGEELSIHLLHPNRAFLSLAFTLDSQRVVGWEAFAVAIGGGMLAALVAVLAPLHDVLGRVPLLGRDRGGRALMDDSGGWLALLGLACLTGATLIMLLAPRAAIVGMVLLVGALLLVLPYALATTLALERRLAGTVVSAIPHVAAMELGAARSRAVAIAATGAVAVFGGVAIRGAHDDLLAGLDGAARETNAFTDLWVSPAGSFDLLNTAPFPPTDRARLERLAGVAGVSVYRGGLLDYGSRRALVLAPSPRRGSDLLEAGQIVQGDPAQAQARLQEGGWVVLSRAIAAEHDLHVGRAVTLPTPDPTALRIAALSSNVGWVPGAIMMSPGDYARAWGSADASAYEVTLAPGASPARVSGEIRSALGDGSGLVVQSAALHAERQRALSRQALSRLQQIAALILLSSVLAIAAAMGAMVWQRRPRLAKLKLDGLRRAQLWWTILLESLLLLGVGCTAGAIFGIYGQQLADRWLTQTIDFPVVHTFAAPGAVGSLALVLATALAIVAVPGYLAASVPASLALADR